MQCGSAVAGEMRRDGDRLIRILGSERKYWVYWIWSIKIENYAQLLAFLVVCNILIQSGVHDVGDVDSPYVIEKHEAPHYDNGDREAVADKEDCVVLK